MTLKFRQFVKYGLSGGLAVAVHFAILWVLVEIVSANPTFATSVGFLSGCAANYVLQHRWVFRAGGAHRVLVGRYAAVTSATFVLNVGLFHLLVAGFEVWYLASQFVSTAVVFLANFEINRRFTFKLPAADPA